MKKVIVIGAGIGGLASAVRMAVRGYEVEVFEANEYPGGKLTEIRLGDFRFDAGPSLFTMPELVDELFELAGKDAQDHFQYANLDEICAYFYEDGTKLVAHSDIDRFASEARAVTGVEIGRIKRHLKKSAFIYRATSTLFLGKSLHKIKTYLSVNTLRSFLKLPFLNIFISMDRANMKALSNEKMVQLFNRYATYNGSNPYRAPGILNIIPHLEFGKGAFFPKGGMHSITLSLYNLAISLGVRFHFNTPVDRIFVSEGKVEGIKYKNGSLNSDLVICNMDVVPAYKKLMPDQKQPEKILDQERSSSALIFYWGMNASFKELKVHNIFFSSDYKREFESIFDDKGLSEDPTVYIHISSKIEKNDAPENMENWFVMINVPSDSGGQDWDRLIPLARERIIKKLNRILNESLEEKIIVEDYLDPRRIESRTQSFQGALYGTSSNKRMAAFFRHPNFSRKIKGLYFCGGSVHPGGGIPLALSSAKIVDTLIK